MRTKHLRIAIGTAAILAAATLAQGALGATTTGTGSMRLSSNLLPGLSRLRANAHPTSQQMSIGVALQRPYASAEAAYVAGLYDPHSSVFHHFLSPAQIAQRFGVEPARTRRVERELTRAGLHVDSVSSTGDYISASGTVAQVERAFQTHINSYTSRGVTFLANTVAPLVHTADRVISVVGLNTLQRYSTPRMTGPAKAGQDQCIGATCTGNLNPADLWGAYDLPAKYEGAGQSVAIIGEGLTKNIAPALRMFEKANKLPKVPVHAHCVEKRSCGTDQSGEVEWFLDTQASTGMAPLTKSIELYFSQQIYDHSLNQAFIGWIDDPKAPRIANASLIECEQTPLNPLFTKVLAPLDGNNGPGVAGVSIAIGNDEEQVLDPQLIKIALQGKTLFASAGDGGSSCALAYLPIIGGGNVLTNDVVPMTNYPAVSPWVVAVGGTALTTTSSGNGGVHRQNEFGDTYGGGGTSLWEAAPPWQALEPHVKGHCLLSPDGSTANNGKLCRGVPDVAAIEGEGEFSFYNIYGPSGYLYGEGGTSLSSPLWAGVWTRVAAAAKHPLGNAGPLLYLAGTNPTKYKRDFYDITVGPNGLYSAGPGWDYVTGFGAPDGAGLIKDIALAAPPVR